MRRLQQATLVTLLVVSCAAKKGKRKKGEEPAGPLLGWHQAEGATGACFHPPDFEAMGLLDRRAARDQVLQEILGQWKGGRADGVALDEAIADGVETILLGYPEKIEQVARDNLAQCQKAMGGGGTDAWSAWLRGLPTALVKGECMRPLDATMFWYADLGMGWQGPASVCDDDVIRVVGSSMDMYRVDDKGPWINAAGDPDKPARGAEYPCNIEGCLVGQLVLRFRGESGVEVVKPVGLELVFDPPEHGQIEFMINDTTYFNNEFKVERGMQHRTAVTYEPVD